MGVEVERYVIINGVKVFLKYEVEVSQREFLSEYRRSYYRAIPSEDVMKRIKRILVKRKMREINRRYFDLLTHVVSKIGRKKVTVYFDHDDRALEAIRKGREVSILGRKMILGTFKTTDSVFLVFWDRRTPEYPLQVGVPREIFPMVLLRLGIDPDV